MSIIFFLLSILIYRVTASSSPNILHFLVDDFGYSDVSWNNPHMKTPVLEQLAKEGIILDQYYSQSRCSPSRAALLTGRYPYKMSIQRGNISPFRPYGLATMIPTLPEILKSLGYTTHLVGKWHLGFCNEDYLPTQRGFDTFFGQYSQQTDHFTRVDSQNKHIGAGYDLWRNETLSTDGAGTYSSKLWSDETVSLLDKLNMSSNPWFIQVSFTGARAPFQAPDKYMKIYDKGNKSYYKKEDFEMEVIRKGMISAVDEAVGEILKKLNTMRDYDNTLVVFSSDNGSPYEKANLPFRGKRGHLTEGAVRVPALVTGPIISKSRRGKRCKELIHITDWFPTILSLAGYNESITVDGFDIWPILQKGAKGERDMIVYNLDMDDQSGNFQFGVRRENWKLLWGHPERFAVNKRPRNNHVELYDLSKDPYEMENLSKTHNDLVKVLQQLVIKLTEEMLPSFQPNRYSLGYPRYQDGLIRPGWCQTGWWNILWKQNQTEAIKKRLLSFFKN